MDKCEDQFKNKGLAKLWVATNGFKANFKSETKLINKDELIESALNKIYKHVTIKHNCMD